MAENPNISDPDISNPDLDPAISNPDPSHRLGISAFPRGIPNFSDKSEVFLGETYDDAGALIKNADDIHQSRVKLALRSPR